MTRMPRASSTSASSYPLLSPTSEHHFLPGMAHQRSYRASAHTKRLLPLLSRADIESMIADGHKVVIVDQHVLKIDSWLPYHPGGEKPILHMVGRDATDEVSMFHSPETRQQMHKYRIGRIEGPWENFIPPIQGGAFCKREICKISDTSTASTGSTVSWDTDPGSGTSSRSISPPPIFDDGYVGGHDRNPTPTIGRRRHLTAPVADCTVPADRDEVWSGPRCGESNTNNEGDTDTKERMEQVTTSFLDVRTREEIRLDLERYPSLDANTQKRVVEKYRDLHKRVEAAGLFDCNYSAYAWEVARYTLLFALMVLFLRLKWYATSAVCLGAFWHQLVFTVHDAGHMGITHNFYVDSVISIIIANFLGGLSVCWWKDNHNVHHVVTNSPEHDPDIEHMPFFAISHRFFQSLKSTYYERVMEYDAAARLFLSVQSWSYYLVLCFGRFNLYRLSWRYIILGLGPRKGKAWWFRWFEAVGQLFFWSWFGYCILYRSIDSNWDRFIFVMVSHIVTMPVHVQITLSHFAMSTADLGPHESFPQRMLRTTMDVDCPQWLDFFHGGLQFQAIHHLYPRMPRHNLRRAQKLVQDFCDDVDIPYALYGFVDGNKEVIGRLADVSRQAAILAQCRRAIVEGKA